MFCPKCGAILMPKKDGNKKMMACSCGYKSKEITSEPLKESKIEEKKEVEVIDQDDFESLPLTDAECEKCGHKRAHYWLIQTRSGDEPETKFLRCEECKHTWRDYS